MRGMPLALNARIQASGWWLGVLIASSMLIFGTWSQFNLNAFGCDPFGYARQAQLFRDHGFLKGFDTRIETPESREIVEVAKSVIGNSFFWAHAAGPHCHHYEDLSGRVILQYPPGTGLLLSVFPEPVAMAYWMIIGSALACAIFVGLIVLRRGQGAGISQAILAFGVICWLITRTGSTGSPSIPFSILLCPAVAVLSFLAFPVDGAKGTKTAALGFGLICGLLLIIRLANAFLLIGLAVQVLLASRVWRRGQLRLHAGALGLASVAFLATGPALLFYANFVNAGSAFASTYGSNDASPPVVSIEMVLTNLRFYLSTWYGTPPFVIAITLIGLTVINRHWKKRLQQPFVAGGIAILLISVGYFLTHEISIEYYLVPASVLVICLVSIGSLIHCADRGELAPRRRAAGLGIVVLSAIAFVVARGAFIQPYKASVQLPAEVMGARTLLWADHSSGSYFYYLGKFAAPLTFIEPGLREDMVRALAHRGWTQYFVLDSPQMYRARNLLTNSMELSDAGVAVAFGEYPVWKLEPAGVDVPQERMKISSYSKLKYTPAQIGRLKFKLLRLQHRSDQSAIDIEIVNPNDIAIAASSVAPIRISWRFIDAQGRPLSGWDARKSLAFDVPASGSLKMSLSINLEGDIRAVALQFSLVQEGEFWAHDVGVDPLTIPLQ